MAEADLAPAEVADDPLFGGDDDDGEEVEMDKAAEAEAAGEGDGEEGKEAETTDKAALGIHFCRMCNSMMRPRENVKDKKLFYKCFNCLYAERDVDHKIVYRNTIVKDVKMKLSQYNDELRFDPTLPRTYAVECSACTNNEAVMFLARTGTQDSMTLVFQCVRCGHKWL